MILQVNPELNLKINKQSTMKKLLFSVLCTGVALVGFSQDLKTAKSALDKGQLDKAKTEIDAYVVKSPTDAEGLYMKAKIYEKIASDPASKGDVAADARLQALDAFKKSMADTSNPKMTLISVKDQYSPIIGLYSDFFKAGADAFNAAAGAGDKAGFATAMNEFTNANNTGKYIGDRKWARIPEVDTVLVLNIGKAALNAGKNDTALVYFKKIADAGISGQKADGDNNQTYELPYQWLALHYKEVKDEANLMKYAGMGKKMFPNEDYFDLVMIDYYRDKKDNTALFAKYDELIAKKPDSLMYHFNYANDIFGYLYNGDAGATISNKDALQKTLGEQIEKAHSINPNDVLTNWLYAQYYYNKGIDTRDEGLKIKGPKPDDVKKKADLAAAAKENFNKAIPYGEKAMSTLEASYKKSDKSRFKSIADLMQKIYESLNQKDKVKLYQDKYDGADAKFVN
jgi:hypothetical protein